MATLTINSTTPSAAVNLDTLHSAIDKILTADRINQPINLSPDEAQILCELKYAVTTGVPTSTYTVTSIAITYS